MAEGILVGVLTPDEIQDGLKEAVQIFLEQRQATQAGIHAGSGVGRTKAWMLLQNTDPKLVLRELRCAAWKWYKSASVADRAKYPQFAQCKPAPSRVYAKIRLT